MVLNCVAYNCKNLQDKRNAISFHTFPFKRPAILELWVKAVRRENWFPSRTSRLCGAHFLSTDYLEKPGCTAKILKPDAVPSIFSFPKHLIKKLPLPRRKIVKHELDTSIPMNTTIPVDIQDIDMPSTSNEPSRKFVDDGTQTAADNSVKLLRRKVKTLKQKVKRRDVKISTMKDVIGEIKNSGSSNESLNTVLQNYFEGLPLELVLLQKKDKEETAIGQRRYSDVMKQFAHTLYFYSPKAYNFVRQYFVLPNGRTIRKWLSSVNCEPGVLMEVLNFLKKEVKTQHHLKNCSLIFDAMAIRKQTMWDNQSGKYTGNVNYGGIIDVDFEMSASEALVFQIVSYTGHFKCPVAYFLINKLDSNLQAQLITTTLKSLFDIGINIRSITSDGTSVNTATYGILGCNLNLENLVPFFSHPSKPTINVYCMLDTCHMLKLMRNALAETVKTLSIESPSGNISWKYIMALDALQQKEQLKLANSLSSQHVNFNNKVMNVRLAAQTLSSGVADAIEYLDNCGVSQFQNSMATVELLRKTDKIFDILNCRNPYGKGYKAPIRPNTLKYFEEVFSDATNYFKSLKINGIPFIQHGRKTAAVGFILTMKSTLGLAKDLFVLVDNPLKYFLSYKCSQDNLEIFFSAIRSRGGWNNNPNTQQLKWALRQLLYKNSITGSVNANCMFFENLSTPAFEFRSESRQKKELTEENIDFETITTYINHLENKNLSDIQENVIFYISGYIVRNLIKNTSCSDCINILLFKELNILSSDHSYTAPTESHTFFTSFVTHGGLIYASDIIFQIVSFCEKQFRVFLDTDNIFTTKTNIKKLLINTAIHHFSSKIHLFKPTHPVEGSFSEECHEIQIVRKVIEVFLKCRMHHHSRLVNCKVHGSSATVRQKLTKLILFNNC